MTRIENNCQNQTMLHTMVNAFLTVTVSKLLIMPPDNAVWQMQCGWAGGVAR